MIHIRMGDYDAKGDKGGSEYVVDFTPTLTHSVRLLQIIDGQGREDFEQAVDRQIEIYTPEKIKELMMAEYDKFAAYVEGTIKVVR
jgi:hypothetical protein